MEPVISTTPVLVARPNRVVYENMHELVLEWQEHGGDSSLWEYLSISESIYKSWVLRIKNSQLDT